MGKKITVDGHGHATVDCQATSFGDLPKRGFIFANGETRETVLRGLKITRCQSGRSYAPEYKRTYYGFSDQWGAGILIKRGRNVSLNDVYISECDAYGLGGALYIHGSIHMTNVSIHGLGGWRGGMYHTDGHVQWAGGTVSQTKTRWWGGSAISTNSSVLVEGVNFWDNSVSLSVHAPRFNGGTVVVAGHALSSSKLIGCKFYGNSAPLGANGTDLSIHPNFTGTVQVIDTNFTSSVFDLNSRIQTCNASNACTIGNLTGTCANADVVGVYCYGCQGIPIAAKN